jgi:lactoylglutathione lyase
MHIEHIALWTRHLEEMKTFYQIYFSGHAGQKYINPTTNFESYFMTFASGVRLELMRAPDVEDAPSAGRVVGYAHFAFSVGSREKVDRLTQRLAADGYKVVGQPRTTGDGYYESVVLDPDGNRVEITI